MIAFLASLAVGAQLVFSPTMPRPGSVVHVSYSASGALRSQRMLVLRLQFHAPRDMMMGQDAWERAPVVVTRLTRRDGGQFSGEFRFPKTAVYAAAAVADTAATVIDTNGGALWELLAPGDGGRPALHALLAQVTAHQERGDWDTALRCAAEATTLYPRSPLSWYFRTAIAGNGFGPSGLEKVKALVRPYYAAMDRELRQTKRASGDDLGAMRFFAAEMDSTAGDYWRDRLIREAPLHPLAIAERAGEIGRMADPAARLDSVEMLWSQGAPPNDGLFALAFSAAVARGDAGAVTRWNDRLGGSATARRARTAASLARIPSFADSALILLRTVAFDSSEADVVPITVDETRHDVEVRVERLRALARQLLGAALLRRGDSAQALHVLAPLSSAGWYPASLQLIGRLQLAAGDSGAAQHTLGQLLVDPFVRAAFADSVRKLRPALASDSAWHAFLSTERVLVRQRLESGAARLLPIGALRLASWDDTTLIEVPTQGSGPTLVAFWSRTCPGSRGDLPRLHRLADRLRGSGLRLMVVTEEPPSPELKAFVISQHVDLSIYHDLTGEAARRMGVTGTPFYVVLNAKGEAPFGTEHALPIAGTEISALLP